jgi:hypothetical protein
MKLLCPENEGFLQSTQIKRLQMRAYSLQAQLGEWQKPRSVSRWGIVWLEYV